MRSLPPVTRSALSLAFFSVIASAALPLPAHAQDWLNPFDWGKSKSGDDEEKKEEQNDIPFGPIDEKGRAVEKGELDPVMAPDGSGLPYELWRGLTLTKFAEALGTIELPPRSPALNALWRRLITANVTAPAGAEGADQFTALRAEALMLSGLPEDAERALTQAVAAGGDARISVLAAQAQIGNGHRDQGCETAKRFLAAEAQIPKGLKADAIIITGYCAVARGDTNAASLQAGLARELDTGSPSPDILDAVANDAKAHLPAHAKITLLDYRIAELKGGFREALKLNSASPAMLAAVARDAAAPPDVRAAAGERAAAFNALAPEELGLLYEAAGAGGDAAARAALFKSAQSELTPLKKARLIRDFLDEARRAGLYWPALKLMDKPALTLAPVAEIGWFAETAIEVHVASGNFERARTWAEFGSGLDMPPDGSTPKTGDLSHWLALIDIADPEVKSGGSQNLKSVEDMAVSGQFDAALLHRLATVLDALDINVPIPLWDVASRTPQPSGGHLPDTGVLTELADASKKKEYGRTVVLALRTLGPQGVEGANIIALGDTIRALKRAGLEREAKLLALEAVFPAWPRAAGH